MGRRKYTQLRQTLLGDDIIFPSYSKVADLRNPVILRSSISLYPDPVKPIGVYTPYSLQVQRTLERILSTVDLPTSEDFPLTFRKADGLDGSGCHTNYNQQLTNTSTKNLFNFVSNLSLDIRVSLGREFPFPQDFCENLHGIHMWISIWRFPQGKIIFLFSTQFHGYGDPYRDISMDIHTDI